ncbi:putative bifunctional diguanylate cyclase/phosphodiesterase [Actinomadura viridis]|uniref:putative bifunctional diguanylate cyclase/phosphodiesterase n=1 Tax=Actinomadura viridis TaxID=58110 RepID=UPI00368118D3
MVAIAGVLYAVGSLLGWGGRTFLSWSEVAAAAIAAGTLLAASRRPSSTSPVTSTTVTSTTVTSTTVTSTTAASSTTVPPATTTASPTPATPTTAPAASSSDGGPFPDGTAPAGPPALWRASLRWYGLAAASWFVAAVGGAVSATGSSRSALSLSVFDLFYLIAAGAVVTGLVVPIRLPRDAYGWARYAADTYVCAAALFVLGWVALFGGLYHRSGETPSEFLLELLYPLIDIVLVCGALPFVLGAARGHRRPAWTAYGVLAAFAAADLVTMVVRLRGGGPADDPADILRLGGLLLLILIPLSASVPSGARGTASRDTASAPVPAGHAAGNPALAGGGSGGGGPGEEECGRVAGPGIAPAAAAAAAALFVAGHSLTGAHGLEPVVPLVAGTAVLVVLARLAALLRENDRLRRAVDTGEDHFRALSESINDAVLICDLNAVVHYASAGALRTYHYTPEELLGRPLHEIVHPEDLPRVRAVFSEFVAGDKDGDGGDPAGARDDTPEDPVDDPEGPADDVPAGAGGPAVREAGPGTLRLACRVRAADGTWLPTESTISRYSGTGKARNRLLVTTRDLSEQAALRRQVTHLTFHDGLTGLPNRAYFEERTREMLSRQWSGDKVAVLFVDIDGFTAVNDSAGHAAGDQVLAQAARRLRGTVQADDTVSRWGGDEFAVLVQLPADAAGGPGGPETGAAVELAERMLRVLTLEPYRVGGKGIALTASIGIAFAGDEEGSAVPGPGRAGDDAGRRLRRSAADLIRNGDLAMARAKELGGGRVEVFAPHMHADVVRRLELGSDLRRAVAEEQFAVEFQPVVELTTSRVTGVEALLRWWRGSESVSPEEFIGPAEESGLMVPLGDWVLREACREVARWRGDSCEIGLSVNFTARQIAAPRFVESVAAALEETGLPPRALTLEVREEVLVEDAGQNVRRLSALRDLGVRLAIDDFGTGYASLAYLGQLPVDIIKIDPSFVAGLGSDETLTLLTRTIVRLGSDLGLTVVAEGIERPEQLELLREMGCPRGQGFLVARPMAAGRVEALVRTNLEAQDLPGEIALPLEDPPLPSRMVR